MRFLTLLLYLLIGLVVIWFASSNWQMVTLNLWSPYELRIALPVLVILAILLGALPGALLHSVSRWNLKRQLRKCQHARTECESALEAAELRLAGREEATGPDRPEPLAQAQPIVVPPAGA